MDEMAWRAVLFDFYGALLTPKQREIYDWYYQKDLSLGEIAKEQGVSRQAVYDLLKRSDEALNTYEEKLELVKKYEEHNKLLREVRTLMVRVSEKHPDIGLHDLFLLINKIEDIW